MKEVLRFHNIASFIARQTDEDVILNNDYKIEKGTKILIPIRRLNLDPKYWDEPEKFNPDRFDSNTILYSYMPFGFGSRVCSGQKLSNVETRLTVILLLQKFDFELDMPLKTLFTRSIPYFSAKK
jgi:cytochrome P450